MPPAPIKAEPIKAGPITCGIAGTQLTDDEHRRLQHPAIGGVILFRRNYADNEQLAALVAAIRAARPGPLIVSVDHEGGRVQRFREGLTAIPAMRCIGHCYDDAPDTALAVARDVGWIIGAELGALDIDHSYTPVLDLDHGESAIIGDRALHSDPEIVVALAQALISGLRDAGMVACGKHFPGHGAVRADSHEELPVDARDAAAIAIDLQPYRPLAPHLAAIMPAHVVFPALDAQPAGVSPYWLQRVLRDELEFGGAIITDDIGMRATQAMGGPIAAGRAALDAGADVLLSCNDPETTDSLLAMAAEHRRAFDAEAVMRRLQLARTATSLPTTATNIAETRLARQQRLRDRLAPWLTDAARSNSNAPPVGEP